MMPPILEDQAMKAAINVINNLPKITAVYYTNCHEEIILREDTSFTLSVGIKESRKSYFCGVGGKVLVEEVRNIEEGYCLNRAWYWVEDGQIKHRKVVEASGCDGVEIIDITSILDLENWHWKKEKSLYRDLQAEAAGF